MDWTDMAQDRNWKGSYEHGNTSTDALKCWEVPE
jgi:hypothetical protein